MAAPSKLNYAKRIVILCDGTWADRNSDSKATVIQKINKMIPRGENITFYQEGVGTSIGMVEKLIGGATGRGVKENVIRAFGLLCDNYSEDLEIVILGFSRGAYTARSLAGLIAKVGIPREKDDEVYQLLTKEYVTGKLKKGSRADYLRKKYKCFEYPQIAFLGCFDTVGSLGIPNTGILGFLKISKFLFRNVHFHETDPGPNVRYAAHALALHECRRPFTPTLMHIPQGDTRQLKQVWFLGTHGDLGWDDSSGGLVDAPLAWMLQQLKTAVRLECKANDLEERFPRSSPAYIPAKTGSSHEWVFDPVRKTYAGIITLMGRKTRTPGRYHREGMMTSEEIHISVRLRDYGPSQQDPPIPGYSLDEVDGKYVWVESAPSGKDGNIANTLCIPEATIGEHEAELLGLPLP